MAMVHIWRAGCVYEYVKNLQHAEHWVNIRDTRLPRNPIANVADVDVRSGLPLADDSADVVYAQHIIEHYSAKEAEHFLNEVKRVLRPNGLLRLSTPDLERQVRLYLSALDSLRNNADTDAASKHHYATLTLIDQMARPRSGGLQHDALCSGELNKDYVRTVSGPIFDNLLAGKSDASNANAAISGWRRLLYYCKRILGRTSPRQSGEALLWMYDRVSLSALLAQHGFTNISVCDHDTSLIDDWSRYRFDSCDNTNSALEPGLYMEARVSST